jgi:hypothetical protein
VSRRGRGGALVTLVLLACAVAGVVYLLTGGRAALDGFVGPQQAPRSGPADGVLVYPLR